MGGGLRFVALVGAALALSGQAPKQDAKPASQQQANPAQQPAPVKKKPTSSSSQQRGCPGTRFPKYSCEAITAEATMRQVDLAREQTDLAKQNNWLNLVTALVAGLAAYFAARAAGAATKSYKAFVAAEDAHLVLDFEQGPYGQWTSGGVTKDNYSFRVTVSNVGRSAARLQRLIFKSSDGSVARSFGETLQRDASTPILSDWLMINADSPTANVQISYATALHPVTHFDVVVGMDVEVRGRKATAYVVSSRIGRPRQK